MNNSPTRKDRRIRIVAREVSKYCKPANKRIMIAKYKTIRTDHYRMVKHKQPITIAKQSYQKGPANKHCVTSNAKHKGNANRNLCKTMQNKR